MKRYFFNTANGAVVKDARGVEFESDAAALQAAAQLLGEMLAQGEEGVGSDFSVVVKREDERWVGSTEFRTIIPGEPD